MVLFTDVDSLQTWLVGCGIDVSSWNAGEAKSIENLLGEVSSGETQLFDDPPTRKVEVVQVIIRRNQFMLIEAEQIFSNGRIRLRDVPPSEKMHPGENPFDAAVRCLEEELGCTPDQITVYPESYDRFVRRGPSRSYPGLITEYHIHSVHAAVSGLPDTTFYTDESAKSATDPVSQHRWEWQKVESVSWIS